MGAQVFVKDFQGVPYCGGYVPVEEAFKDLKEEIWADVADDLSLMEERARHTAVLEAYRAINDETTKAMIREVVARALAFRQEPDTHWQQVAENRAKALNDWMSSYEELRQRLQQKGDVQKALTFWKRLALATAASGVAYPALHLLGFI